MNRYIFHMGDGSQRIIEANTLTEALEKIGLAGKKPIGIDDGRPDSIVLIEIDTKQENSQ